MVGDGAVIQGLDLAVQKINEGEKCLFRIPPALAYGSMGVGGLVGPEATLLLELELLKVTKPVDPNAVDDEDEIEDG